MLKDHMVPQIRKNLTHIPTHGQALLIETLADFITDKNNQKILIVKGYAGTGKTSVIGSLVKTLDTYGVRSVLLAPTGRAAKVFSGYAGRNAYTIHRKIYIQKSSKDGFGDFVLGNNLHKNTIFLVDEASMISNNKGEDTIFGTGKLLDDLVKYIKSGTNCKLILIGDTAQLPPVGIALSPALNVSMMNGYYKEAEERILTEVVRQAEHSGILFNATIIRNLIVENKSQPPALILDPFEDVGAISSNELIETLEKNYSHYGIEDTIVICRSNKRANQFNLGIRNMILFREEEITSGDLLMVVRNNYFWLNEDPEIEFIANGDIVRVLKIKKYIEQYSFRFAYASLQLIDYGIEFDAWILLDTLKTETPSLSGDDNKKLFYNILEDYQQLKPRKKQVEMVRANPFFNALQVKFAYAVTCHKAQGGQWKAVFIDQGYVRKEMIDREYLRWLYTAFTRATEKLVMVNFPDYFFEKSVIDDV